MGTNDPPGGAERLIVDAAIGLQEEGHSVRVFTSHCDRTHCFEEITKDELALKVYGDWLPTGVLGRFKIVFAMLRQFVLLMSMIINGEVSEYDFFIVDQLSFCLPLLHLFHEDRARILFYCHFPDQKLARHDSVLRNLYRLPFDILEQFSMSAADGVVVNSGFTKSVYNETFSFIKDVKKPGIIYPCVDATTPVIEEKTEAIFQNLIQEKFFLSVNRFEVKKNVDLAIETYVEFLKSSKGAKLVIAGGYDTQNQENKDYLQKLEKLVEDSGLKFYTLFQKNYETLSSEHNVDYDVLFLPSVPSNLKDLMLSKAELLLYTPSFEHFGIVPLEAMKVGTPVLAVDNGGPTETVISLDEDAINGTGWLVSSDAKLWSEKLIQSLSLDNNKMKTNGVKQVKSKFTRKVMTEGFERTMLRLFTAKYERYSWENLIMLWRLPAFFLFRRYFKLPAILVWVLGSITFLPPSIFQLIGTVVTVGLYLAEPTWFAYFD